MACTKMIFRLLNLTPPFRTPPPPRQKKKKKREGGSSELKLSRSAGLFLDGVDGLAAVLGQQSLDHGFAHGG